MLWTLYTKQSIRLQYVIDTGDVINLKNEHDPSVESDVGEDDLAEHPCDAEVASDAVDGDVSARIVLVVSRFVVDVDVDARSFRVTVTAAERKAVLPRGRRSAADARRTIYQSNELLIIIIKR